RRELVEGSVDADGGDRRALERREQDPAERVADGDAEAALERLADELGVEVVRRLGVDRDPLRTDEGAPVAGDGAHVDVRHAHASFPVFGFGGGAGGGRRTRLQGPPLPAYFGISGFSASSTRRRAARGSPAR